MRSSAAGPHWLTAEHQLHTELVSSPAVQHRRVFISPPCQVCWCHHVRQCIDAISLLQQSQVGGKEVTSTGVTIHAGGGLSFKIYVYIFFILSFQSYGMIHKVWSQSSILSSLNTYIPPKTEAELLSPFTTTDLMGTSSALLFAFIYLLIWITCILPPWKYSHTSCPERDYAYSLLMKPSVNIFSFFPFFSRVIAQLMSESGRVLFMFVTDWSEIWIWA